MTSSSTSMRTSSRTNSGLPSVDAGSRSISPAGSRSVPSRPAASCAVAAWSSPSSASTSATRRPVSASDGRTSRSSGRARHSSITAAPSTHSARCSSKSRSLGSAHWMSSITITTRTRRRERLDQAADRPERLFDRSGRGRAVHAGEDVGRAASRSSSAARSSAMRSRASSAVASSSRPAASRMSCATGANVASPARSHRISNVHRVGVGRGAARDLAREARLADAGRAEHGDELRRPVRDRARRTRRARVPSRRRGRRTARPAPTRRLRSRPRRSRRARRGPRR